MNNWIGLGRMVRDPEVRYTQTGKPVAQFTIAINRPYKNADGNYIYGSPAFPGTHI